VQGFAQALLDGTAGTPEAQKQAAQVIFDEAGCMHRMVVDLARWDAGTFDLQRTPVNLVALLNNSSERFVPQARAGGVNILVETTILPDIIGDGDRLAQVFFLVDNALKFTPAGGKTLLHAKLVENCVQVEVSDTGDGIPPEALARVFDRFYQADASRPGGEKHGTGLGLAIAKEIVEAHGGKISVCSDLGRGSTFIINLPLTMPEMNKATTRRKE
jgi:signal transduction histidine kinase